MPKRKGRKAPSRDPRELASAPKIEAQPRKKVKASRYFYTGDQKHRLRDRLRRILSIEARIPEIIDAMERGFIAPDVLQLKRKLKRAGIYPPPVDNQREAHKLCFGPCCKGLRSHPAYYVKAGLDFEAREDKKQVAAESLIAAAADDAEEIERLRGESPGVVVKMEREGRRGKAA